MAVVLVDKCYFIKIIILGYTVLLNNKIGVLGMSKILVSAALCIDVSLKIKGFPVKYEPIDINTFGIESVIGGVCANVSKGFKSLGDCVDVISLLSGDDESERIRSFLKKEDIGICYIDDSLKATPHSVIMYDQSGRRLIESDMKDIYEKSIVAEILDTKDIDQYDAVVFGNFSFNYELIKECRKRNKLTVCDVQVLDGIDNEKNKNFMKYTDILFFSDEKVKDNLEDFMRAVASKYNNKIIVVGRGKEGAALYITSEDKVYISEAPDIRPVVNTVGAGDALCTAFVHYYLKGDKPIEALKKAEIFASYKIGESGASVGFPNESIVENYYRLLK